MHMRCPNCGTENADTGSRFCQKCGTPLTFDAQQAAMQMAQPMGAPPAKKGVSTAAIVIIAVVAVVAIVVIAGVWFAVSSINHVTHGSVDMSVTDVAYPTNLTSPPATGDKLVQLTVHMTNNGDTMVMSMYTSFKLEITGGAQYMADYRFSDTMSTSLLPGGSATLVLTFETPSSAVPHKLMFNGIFGSAECNVPA